MRIKRTYRAIAVGVFLFAMNAYADMQSAISSTHDKFRYPFYVGVTAGYGTTTWDKLVSTDQIAAMSLSTPIHAEEGGTVWGVFGGYELMPAFAIEASYMRFPSAKVDFDSMSLFAFDHGSTELTTKTDMVSLSGKFMVLIPHTSGMRVFSSAGAAGVHRNDYVRNAWILSPTFGVGFNYNLTEHAMFEIGANYTTGNGQSELDPAEHYVPFTYAVFARTAYRF